ncbi:helix-turn-helix domain-containing protein [Marinomonas transparens]|uniref:Helix-turn-helix domain-containing protein n=1 Tax=Marinomonas transparens TaxID=2795388 RepID=A0A934JTX1_9GAMM|nr:helix-turn-helix domain-containing protein [Marinomonas transparens]MBJ7539868.1 helix-turn-helix domain-containing protein [Marinomonas transparens]
MSVDATRWAWLASPSKSSELLVLLSMADRAGEDHTCWPSVARLVKDTKLNEKTVNTALKGLVVQGLIRDTGKRVGSTGRVKVYRLIGVLGRDEQSGNSGNLPQSENANTPNNGGIHSGDEIAPNTGEISNTPKNGILPILPCNTPDIGGTKYPQNRGSEPITLEPIIEPNTSLGSPSANAPPKPKRACSYPNDFSVDQGMVDWLNEKGVSTPWPLETEKFANYHIAKGSTFKDWKAAWRGWMLNSMKYSVPAQSTAPAKNVRQGVNDELNNINDTDW